MLADIMETFKINKRTDSPVTLREIKKPTLFLSGNSVCLIASMSETYDLSEGSRLNFHKSASGNSGQMVKVCEDDVIIEKIVDVKTADGLMREIYFEYTYIEPFTVTSFVTKPPILGGYNYKLYFDRDCLIAPGDFAKYKEQTGKEYIVYCKSGKDVIHFSSPALCYPYEFVEGKDVEATEGSCCSPSAKYFNYETMERNSILFKTTGTTSGTGFTPEQGQQALFSTNPYYFTKSGADTGIVLYDNVSIMKYTDYMGLGVNISQEYDSKRLYQEYQVNELFVKKIKNNVIPGFLDLEKVKYVPAYVKETDENDFMTSLATGLTFNLHFRTRVSGKTEYSFDDVWHIDDGSENPTWNGSGYTDMSRTQDTLYDDDEFVNSSNLIGFLGFTDDDIYLQKNKVKQSFLRFSFYDSPDPLTQNLLYYSTVFMNAGELYGEYIKRKADLEKNVKDYDETKIPVVWSDHRNVAYCSACRIPFYGLQPEEVSWICPECGFHNARDLNNPGIATRPLTCQFRVNDEYDTTRSAEGFNLYLFKADAPPENDPVDIYMKVEFNHAGYGRTVPLIYWKKGDDEKPMTLTVDKYLENLYIKVRIMLTERGYVYSFPDMIDATAGKNKRKNGLIWEDERLVFNLFEPRITPDKIEPEETTNG